MRSALRGDLREYHDAEIDAAEQHRAAIEAEKREAVVRLQQRWEERWVMNVIRSWWAVAQCSIWWPNVLRTVLRASLLRRWQRRLLAMCVGQWKEQSHEHLKEKAQLRRAVRRMQFATVWSFFAGWVQWSDRLRREREICSRVIRRLAHLQLVAGFSALWGYRCLHKRAKRLVLKLRQSCAQQSFQRWAAVAWDWRAERERLAAAAAHEEVRQQLHDDAACVQQVAVERLTLSLLRRWQRRLLAMCVGQWKEQSHEHLKEKAQLRRAVRRMQFATVWSFFAGWVQWSDRLRREREICSRVIRRLAHLQLVAGFSALWGYRCLHKRAKRLVLKLRQSCAQQSFQRWAAVAWDWRVERERLAAAAAHEEVRQQLHDDAACVQQVAVERLTLSLLRRWQRRLLAMCVGQWKERRWASLRAQAQLRRAVWRRRQSDRRRCFVGWASWCRDMRRRQALCARVQTRRDTRRAVCAFWELRRHRCVSLRGQRAVAKLHCRRLACGFAVWAEVAWQWAIEREREVAKAEQVEMKRAFQEQVSHFMEQVSHVRLHFTPPAVQVAAELGFCFVASVELSEYGSAHQGAVTESAPDTALNAALPPCKHVRLKRKLAAYM
eukprot:SAG11_NODE_16_length_26235_cov_39.900417_10_plen_608_part_00